MATRSKARAIQTLEEFLSRPRIDEKPHLENIDGRVEVKVAARRRHSAIQERIVMAMDDHAQPIGIGEAYPELNGSFAGLSIVPEVVFHKKIDPERKTTDVDRPCVAPEQLALDGVPVLPRFHLAVAEVFGRLRYRTRDSARLEADPR